MSSDLGAVLVGTVLGLMFVGLILWLYRAEVKRSWQMRFGSTPEVVAVTSEPPSGRNGLFPLSPWKRRLALGGSLLASLGNAALAVTAAGSGESLHELIRVLGAVVFAAVAGWIMLKGRPQEG